MSIFDLSNRNAIVTGSSRGIDRAIAQALAGLGANVVISSRKQDACEAVASAINAKSKGRAIAIAASIGDKASLEHLMQASRQKLGEIDILVCNAASNPYYGPLAGISDEQFEKVLRNNVLSSHWLAALVAPGMAERGAGSIILISSIGGMRGSPRSSEPIIFPKQRIFSWRAAWRSNGALAECG